VTGYTATCGTRTAVLYCGGCPVPGQR
jgi:hypothetical protein